MKRVKIILLFPVLFIAFTSSGQTLNDASLLLKKGLIDSAMSIATKYLAADASNADAYLIMGQGFMAKEKFKEAAPYFLKIKTMDNAPAYSRAWAMNEYGISCYATGDYARSKENILGCIAMSATENSVNTARKSALLLGFDPLYNSWTTRETKHFIFHFQDTSSIRNLSSFLMVEELAFDSINNFLHADLPKKIDYFVWRDVDMAEKLFNNPLAFTKSKFCLTHTGSDHTVGHEMTHSITKYAVETVRTNALISEGVAVYFDFSHTNNLARLKRLSSSKKTGISIKEIWKKNSATEEDILYPLGGELVKRLIKNSGREKFMKLLTDQSFESAEKIYGPDLYLIISELEREIKE